MDFQHARPRHVCIRLALTAVCGALLALPAAAQWKWRDKSGIVQYSDLPPPTGVSDKDILQRPAASQRLTIPTAAASAASAAAPALDPKAAEPELEAKRRKAEQDELAKKKAEEQRVASVKAENCTRARSAMRSLEDGVRIARTNDKGEREILNDQQRADETRRAREVVASDCR